MSTSIAMGPHMYFEHSCKDYHVRPKKLNDVFGVTSEINFTVGQLDDYLILFLNFFLIKWHREAISGHLTQKTQFQFLGLIE